MSISTQELTAHRRLHAEGSYPGEWSILSRALAENPATTEAEVQAFLAANAVVPYTRRTRYGYAKEFYAGKATSDPRIAIYDVLEISKTSGIDDKKLARVLGDPHARGVIGLEVGSKGAWKVLLEGLSSSPIESIRYLRGSVAPAPDELAKLLAHPKLARLERLILGGDGKALGDDRIAAIAAMPSPGALGQLWLDGMDKLTARAFDRLGAAAFTGLRSLTARASQWIPRESVRQALFDAPWLSQLRSLSLTDVSEPELAALRARLPLGNLISLGMSLRGGNTPAPPGASTSVIAELRECQSLSISPAPADAIPALIASGCVPQLEELLMQGGQDPALVAAGLGPNGPIQRERFTRAGFWWRWY